MGLLKHEDRKREGLVARSERRRQPDADQRLEPFGSGACSSCRRGSGATAADWIARIGIKCDGPDQASGELSGGNQQKVALTRLLHHDVDVLVLDEPTRGIDDVGRARPQIYRLIDDLAAGGRAAQAGAEGRAHGQQLPARTDRPLPSHRGDARADAAAGRRGRSAGLTESEHELVASRPREPRRDHDAAVPRRSGRHADRRLIVVAVIFGLLVGRQFFAPGNLELMARQAAIVCVAAILA